jgi:lysophospholipase L1-like esterase
MGLFTLLDTNFFDVDAQTYFANTSSLGYTFTPTEKAVINQWYLDMKSDPAVWSAIKEIHIPLGGWNATTITAALVAQKVPPTVSLISTNVGFVDGQWHKLNGFQGSGSQWINPNSVAPSTLGVSKDNLFFQYFTPPALQSGFSSGGNSVFAGNQISGTREIESILGAYVGIGSSLEYVGPWGGEFACGAISNGSQINYFMDWDICRVDNFSPVAPVFNSPFTWFKSTHNGTVAYANGNSLGYMYGTYITKTQYQNVLKYTYTLLYKMQSLNQIKDLVVIGNSITYGIGASSPGNRGAYLLATARGLRECNMGVSGTLMANGADPISIYNRSQDAFKYSNVGEVVIAGGTNDLGADPTTNGDPILILSYKNSIIAIVNNAVASGIPLSKICVATPPERTAAVANATKQDAWAQGALDAATVTGCRSANLLAAFRAGGTPSTLTVDGTHPNDAGMIIWKNTINAALT